MGTTDLVDGPIVNELLNEENYQSWCVLIKSYLMGKDLWDIIENSGEPSKPEDKDDAEHRVWTRKNAAALHAIQISCGTKALSRIKNISLAKHAWDELRKILSSPSSSDYPVNMDYDRKYEPLYKAVDHGTLQDVLNFLKDHPEGVTTRILPSGITALHVAASKGFLTTVEELVKLMSEQDMEMKDCHGYTALQFAVKNQSIKIAECLINKNRNLVMIPTSNLIPVTFAVTRGHYEMACYLYSVTPSEELEPEKGHHGATLLNRSFIMGFIDLALDLLRRCPKLAITPDYFEHTFVFTLSTTTTLWDSIKKLSFWQQCIFDSITIDFFSAIGEFRIDISKSWGRESNDKMRKKPGIKRLYELQLEHILMDELLRLTCKEIATLNNVQQLSKAGVYNALLEAARKGDSWIIYRVIRANPVLQWSNENFYIDLLREALKFRHGNILSLVISWYSPINYPCTSTADKFGNNLLHAAAIFEPSTQLQRASGPALQMQRELQWFKEMEDHIKPAERDSRNHDGLTARELFTKNHKELVKIGGEWMKGTASSCTVVAALIATITFAACFTIPGGNKQDTGYPMFQDKKLFKLFMISDAISLFASTTSVLMFLGILTAHYDEDAFLKSLPTKLIWGLSMLFISIVAMMITFAAAISIMIPGKLWILVPVILFAIIPVSCFAQLQFPLLAVQIYYSTYGPKILERDAKLLNIAKLNSRK